MATIASLGGRCLIVTVLVTLLKFLFLGGGLLVVFLPVFFVYLFMIGAKSFSCVKLILDVFLNMFSRVILSSFAPSKVGLFTPVSSGGICGGFNLIIVFVLTVLSVVCRTPILFGLFRVCVRHWGLWLRAGGGPRFLVRGRGLRAVCGANGSVDNPVAETVTVDS